MTVTRFQQKRGTSAQWAASTTPLRDGEIGIDKDTGLIKVGDGLTLWPQLPTAFSSQYLPLLGKANDSYKLDGRTSDQYMLASRSTDFLPVGGKAADADKLDGIDSTGFLKTSDAASFLPATGKAVDADKLDGLDSTAFALATDISALTSQTSATRKLVTNWGAMTSFPASGALTGDTVLRTDVGTNGSVWVYVGPGKGSAGWVHKGVLICTASSHPVAPLLYDGLEIFETDTKAFGIYDFTASKWRMFDTVWQTYTPALPSGMSIGTGGSAFNLGLYMRRGQVVSLRTGFVFGASGYSGGTGNYQIGLPSGLPCKVSGPIPGFEIEIFAKFWNALGNTTGFALIGDGSTSMQFFGVGASNASNLGLLNASYPAAGWGAGHNIYSVGEYPIA